MSPGLQQFLLSTWLFFSTWLKVLSTVSFCSLRMLSSWIVWFCLPPTHLTWRPASPSRLPSSLPCVTGISSPKVDPDPFHCLHWACFAGMNCKVKPESGWLAGTVHCNFMHVNDAWPKEVFSVQGRTWKNVPAAHVSSHHCSCVRVDVAWCGLRKFYFNSEVLMIFWGILQKTSKGFPLMDGAQVQHVWF